MSYSVFKADFNFGDAQDLLKRRNLEQGGKVQQTIDRTVIRYCIPYVPMQDGVLMQSAYTATRIGSGKVVWSTPYARFHYYGKVMTTEDGRVWARAGEKKPVVTNRDLNHDKTKHPLAGPFWFERMKADRINDIVKEAKSVAGIK